MVGHGGEVVPVYRLAPTFYHQLNLLLGLYSIIELKLYTATMFLLKTGVIEQHKLRLKLRQK